MNIIRLDQQNRNILVSEYSISNEIVFNYFDNLPQNERDQKFQKALYIGVLALMEDRISAFLSKTQNELGTELESLKMLFEMKREIFYKTTIKGTLAEYDIAEFLNNYFSEKHLKDKALLTGNAVGDLIKNKTGDIVCEVNGTPELRIVIECKFDKSIKLGDISTKDIFTKKFDTAWSQLIEAQANRDAKVGIIVFDRSLVDGSILKEYENVGFIQGIGFVVIIDSQKGDYSNLAIAYMLARDIIVNAKVPEVDFDFLLILINRMIKDIGEVISIRSLVESNINTNKEILRKLEKSMLLMEFNQEYLKKYISDGKISKSDLLSFYSAEDVKEKYKQIEKEMSEKYLPE